MKPRLFLPSMLSGFLLWASFFPLDLGPLAFVALVPWLTLVRAEGVSRRRRYLAAYVGGLCFYLPALQWIRVAHPAMYASWIILALYCSLYFALALWLLRRFDRLWQLPLGITLPVVWVALDFCRAHFPTGFPFLEPLGLQHLIGFGWYMPGYTQHSVPPLLQLADLGGVYLVTALICAFNGAAFEWFVRQPWLRRVVFRYPPEPRIGFYREMCVSAVAAFALLLSVGYGMTRLTYHPEFNDGPRVAALQGNIPQNVKIANKNKLQADYTALAQRAILRADLIVWPETCCPNPWYDAVGITDPAQLKRLREIQQELFDKTPGVWGRYTLLGLSSYEFSPDQEKARPYNSAVLVTPDQKVIGRYDKIHLVPMGEYVPLGETFPFLNALTPYEGDYSCTPGRQFTRFRFNVGDKTCSFGVIICYEDTDPFLARQYVRTDPVDFLVNISNDGWFHGTEEHEQHLAICRFRAVECRRTVVRAVNMGISAIIDPDGKVTLPGDSWAQSKNMEELVVGKVKLDTRESLYAKLGDWLPSACWVVILIVLVLNIVRRKRKQPAA